MPRRVLPVSSLRILHGLVLDTPFWAASNKWALPRQEKLTKILTLPSGMGLEHLYRPLSYTHIKKETRAHTSLTVIHRNALYRGRKRESQRTFMMKAARTTSLEQAP